MDAAGIHPRDVRTPADLRHFPILDKRDLRERPETLVTQEANGRQLTWKASSGSTGIPVKTVVCPRSAAWGWAATYRHFRWSGIELGDPMLILWGAAGFSSGRSVSKRLSDALWRRRKIPAQMNTASDVEAQVRQARRFRPALLRGYASALHRFAQNVESLGETLPSLKAVSTTAEAMTPAQRRYVQATLGAEVFDQYGCREIVGVACECPEEKSLHIAEERVVVETTAGPGVEGDLLLTDLYNYTMPLIRYRVGDRAVLSPDPCGCGRSLARIASLAGRVAEAIRLPDGRDLGFAAVSRFFNQYGFIERYQVAQSGPAHLEVRLEHRGSEAEVENVLQALRERLAAPVVITLGKRIESLPSGKHTVVLPLGSTLVHGSSGENAGP
jgi:phenylacetate-CoA ligase